MADGHRDYSATPLSKKLGIGEDARVLLIGAPDGFAARLEPLPPGARVIGRTSPNLDVVVLFATRQAEIERRFRRLPAALTPAGRLWVAWPKRASGVNTDVTFESAQRTGLDAGLVDNKSASVTDVFQGLQFVYRLRDRRGR